MDGFREVQTDAAIGQDCSWAHGDDELEDNKAVPSRCLIVPTKKTAQSFCRRHFILQGNYGCRKGIFV